ncbi:MULTISPECIES: alpha/beta hydrolase [unclassified Jeotgalibaca]|uniref:alpha/beta hydrolase n=1 Tax=unclassified Jeotgalibaca TaxID=2621505 RepID=UPI003FD65AAE
MIYEHIYKPGKINHPTFLVLHGTGGNENDLIPLVNYIDPDAGILSVRGNVSENGMNRYFRRLAEGVFDKEDLEKRTHDLYDFLQTASEEYKFDKANVIALGYSNGANIAASMLYFYEDTFKGAILHHPMTPFEERDMKTIQDLPVFIGAGNNDPICPPENTRALITQLEKAGSKVTTDWGNAGHSLTQNELDAAKSWYNSQFA